MVIPRLQMYIYHSNFIKIKLRVVSEGWKIGVSGCGRSFFNPHICRKFADLIRICDPVLFNTIIHATVESLFKANIDCCAMITVPQKGVLCLQRFTCEKSVPGALWALSCPQDIVAHQPRDNSDKKSFNMDTEHWARIPNVEKPADIRWYPAEIERISACRNSGFPLIFLTYTQFVLHSIWIPIRNDSRRTSLLLAKKYIFVPLM